MLWLFCVYRDRFSLRTWDEMSRGVGEGGAGGCVKIFPGVLYPLYTVRTPSPGCSRRNRRRAPFIGDCVKRLLRRFCSKGFGSHREARRGRERGGEFHGQRR